MTQHDDHNDNNDNDDFDDNDDNEDNNDATHMVIEGGQQCEGRSKRQNK